MLLSGAARIGCDTVRGLERDADHLRDDVG
jgi:hypothetical protein